MKAKNRPSVRRPVFTQGWCDLTYLHWPYPPEVVARYLPEGVVPDVCEGSGWMGLIPFRMRRVAILGTPSLPYLSSFLETNVRTYGVDEAGHRVVVFLSLAAFVLLPWKARQAQGPEQRRARVFLEILGLTFGPMFLFLVVYLPVSHFYALFFVSVSPESQKGTAGSKVLVGRITP